MKDRSPPLTALFTIALTCSLAPSASAGELPGRKPGLWEIDTRMNGLPGIGAVQQCIDAGSDNLLEQKAGNGRSNCSVMEIKPSANRVTIHAVCKIDSTTVTTDAVFEGNFDSAYKGTIKLRYQPPMQGLGESSLSQAGRWLGPCKSGQKPGDLVLPDPGNGSGGTVNINELMKDPKVLEILRSLQR